jgi:hypothetical protein
VKHRDADVAQRLRTLDTGPEIIVPTEALLRGAHRIAGRRRAALLSTTAMAVVVLVLAGAFLLHGGQSSNIPLRPMPTSTAPSTSYTIAFQSGAEAYGSPHILLAPPVRTAKLSAADAWAAYRARGTGYSPHGGQTVVKLVAYTNYGRGTENPDGSMTPEILNRLAWVIEVPAVHTRIRGAELSSPVFVFIDADDGSLIEAIQSSEFKM